MIRDGIDRLAGMSALLAVPAWLFAAGAQALTSIGDASTIARFTDYSIALMLLLLILPAIVIYRLSLSEFGWWVIPVTLAGIAGMLLGAATVGLDASGRISDLIFQIGLGVSGVLLLVWLGALTYIGIHHPHIPTPIGWFAFGTAMAGVLATGSVIADIDVGIWATSTAFAAITTFALLEFGWGFLRNS